jgi:hypothetical protein
MRFFNERCDMHVNGHRSPCHTVNAKAGTQYQTSEACEDIAYAYNNGVFQLKPERLDADGQPSEVWTYYCRATKLLAQLLDICWPWMKLHKFGTRCHDIYVVLCFKNRSDCIPLYGSICGFTPQSIKGCSRTCTILSSEQQSN